MKNMPNTDFIQKWVDALRSGEFQQAKGVLHDLETNGYCCLGVACSLAVDDPNVDVEVEIFEGHKNAITGEIGPVEVFNGDFTSLPYEVAELIGTDGSDVPVRDGDGIEYLSIINDNGNSFEFIADKIEETYLK